MNLLLPRGPKNHFEKRKVYSSINYKSLACLIIVSSMCFSIISEAYLLPKGLSVLSLLGKAKTFLSTICGAVKSILDKNLLLPLIAFSKKILASPYVAPIVNWIKPYWALIPQEFFYYAGTLCVVYSFLQFILDFLIEVFRIFGGNL